MRELTPRLENTTDTKFSRVLSVKATLQWSLDSRSQEGQARDNLIWGGVGGHREKEAFNNVGTSRMGSLDTSSHFQLKLQVLAID